MPSPTSSPTSGAVAYDAIIVGAGCAGLSAGVKLAAAGRRVLILEARSRLGGRATAFVDRESGELVDNGQHVLLGCYTATLAFLEQIGATDHVRRQPDLNVRMIDRDGRSSRLVCPRLPPPLNLLAGIWDWDAIGWRDRTAILRMAGPIRRARRAAAAEATAASSTDAGRGPGRIAIAASPGETVDRWLRLNGQTPRLCEMLWEPLALAALNQPADVAAAPVFARVLAEMFGSAPGAASIVLPTKPLHEAYAEPARRFIERRGGIVRTGTPATIRIRDESVLSVRAGSDEFQAEAVVSAVPWFNVAGLFEDRPAALRPILERAHRMKASPIVTINVWFDRPILDEPFVGLPGRAMQWAFEKREVFGGTAAHVSLVSSGAAEYLERTNNELVEIAHRELLESLPEARRARLLRAAVIREPKATFSLAPGEPVRPATVTPIRGLYLAGDWIETELPATIESAVRSGQRAAEAVLTHLPELTHQHR